MGMSNMIFDNVDKFWDIAENTVSECKNLEEFIDKMLKHDDLLSGSDESETVEEGLYETWKENK
jgi:hypothetical protein